MTKTESLEGQLRDLGEQVRPQIEEVKEGIRDANQRVIAFIKERPITCLLGAAVAGYIIARIVRTKG